jgi:glycosyltransferase involved in cell wall biosynthesis
LNKVIIIGPAHPLRGGLATFNERMASAFTARGYEVIIYTFSLQYPSLLFPGATQYSESSPPENLNIKVAINSINPLNWISTGMKIKNEHPDIVIFRYWLPFMAPALGTIARLIRKNKHTKIIALVDNAIPHESRFGDKMLTRYFVKSIDAFITMSEKVLHDLKFFSNKPTKLIAHPLYDNFGEKVDKIEARRKLQLPEKGEIFLFFGFIRKYKGLDLLIQALEEVDMTNKYLLIAGEYYAEEEEIKAIIKRFKDKDHIIEHTHFIKNEDVRLYFSAADLVIQPYRNATQSGVTPLAYHFEVPMIVTNVGALPDLVPPGIGLVCEPTIEGISHAIDQSSHFDYNQFREKIKTEKQKLSWDTLVDAVSELKTLNAHE